MNILIPAHHFTDDPKSGVDTGFWNFAKHLADDCHKVFVITLSLDLVNETKESLKSKNIYVYKIYNYKTHGLDYTESFMVFIFAVFLRLFHRIDWIFIIDEAKTPFSHFKLGARLASRVIRPRTEGVEKFKGEDWEYDRKRKDIGAGWENRKAPFIYRMFRFIAIRIWSKIFPVKESAENSDVLFCEGMETLKYCRDIGRNNPVYLPLGVENYRIDIQKKAINTKGKFIYLFVGRVLVMKGVYYLIEAFKALAEKYSDIELWIIGPAFGEYTERLERDVSGFEDRIRIIGEKGREDIFKYMKSCDVIVDPMIWANFSSVALEALYCKKPLIGALGGNTKDFVKDGIRGFLVDSRDINLLAEKMEYFYLNPDKAKEMGQNGFEFVSKHLTWNKVAKIVEDNMMFFNNKQKIQELNKKYENYDY